MGEDTVVAIQIISESKARSAEVEIWGDVVLDPDGDVVSGTVTEIRYRNRGSRSADVWVNTVLRRLTANQSVTETIIQRPDVNDVKALRIDI